MIYTERTAINQLLLGKTVEVRGIGNSMTPILKSGQVVIVRPVEPGEKLKRNDIVLAKVRGNVYMHLVKSVRNGQYLIGNNHGRINGWTSQIYGKVILSPEP